MAVETCMNGTQLPSVDPNSSVPRYVQAKQILIGAIQQGLLPRGAKLPSTHDVSDELQVSLLTAHKAIQCLVQEGWLNRERGRGTFVREDFEGSVAAKARFCVGLLLDVQVQLGNYYHAPILHGMRDLSAHNELKADLLLQHGKPSEVSNLHVDGVVCFHPDLEYFQALENIARNRPIVVVGGSTRGTSLHCIDSANEQGSREAIRHLASLGHRDIAIINGRLSASNSLHRYKGYVMEMQAQGLPLRDDYVINSDRAEMSEDTKAALRKLFQRKDRPTAILATGYHFALEVLEVAELIGLKIPQDLSLVGFDDPKSASLLNPSLTTVRQPLEQMGREAMKRMFDLIAGNPPAKTIEILPTELVPRASTAPLGSNGRCH